MKERVERFLRQEEGTAAKEAYLKEAATSSTKPRDSHGEYPAFKQNAYRKGRKTRPFSNHFREDKRHRRANILTVMKKARTTKKPAERPRDKSKYCDFTSNTATTQSNVHS
ncbi:hypothetical protein L2E82_04085 [Cichorium intybus]|uniref:Uncharacterized protein n=1 Tax=Cichorium intybus TaxID=13427 RepID=A0ACB9H4V4_CICIN|nr:hypothetical protein L2E82_04085 [Cichorium intybus]